MKRTRVRVATGIYRDQHGYGVVARVGSGRNVLRSPEIRFLPDAALADMKACFTREKMKLQATLKRMGGGPVRRGTVAEDVRTYLKKGEEILSPQRYKERDQQLAWWVTKFGDRPRASLEPKELKQALNGLARELAGSTVNKYRTALSHVFTVLDGEKAPNPILDDNGVPKWAEPDAEARDIPYEIIQVILAKIRDRGQGHKPSLSKARALVLAYAPVTAAQLRRMKRDAIDWSASEMITPGRKKGRGTKPTRKPISPEALAGFRAFDAAEGWEKPFSKSSFWRTFNRARLAALAELRRTRPDLDLTRLETMRPYDLRHSFGTITLRTTKSLEITKELLDHSDTRTTRRYALGALPELLKDAGQVIAQAFAAVPPYVPPPPPAVPVAPAARQPDAQAPRLVKKVAAK